MLGERLDKAWRSRRGRTDVDALMRFSDDGLVLGAGTVLAKSGGTSRDLSVDPSDPRLRVLLTAAHLQAPTLRSLTHLRKAAECWRERDDALAAMHLVLSGLDRLAQPEADAHRLFLADGMLMSGVEPDAIVRAVGAVAPAVELLNKYDPNQPRVPAGSGRPSGQWTIEGGLGLPSDSSRAGGPKRAPSPGEGGHQNQPRLGRCRRGISLTRAQ